MAKERYTIEIEDLVSNLLIEYKIRNIKDYVTYKEIALYANNIGKSLAEEDIDLVVSMNREKTDRFLQLYSNYFVEVKEESKIQLREGITATDLIDEFRGYLPFNLLLSMIDDNVVTKTIETYKDEENNKNKNF